MKNYFCILLFMSLISTNLFGFSAESKILFWGFDTIFYSAWKDKNVLLRPILEHSIKNLTAVSTDGHSLCILGMETNSTDDALKPFLLDLKTKKIKRLLIKNQPLFNLEISPKGNQIAFLFYQANKSGMGDYKIGIYDIVKESSTILNEVKASHDTLFSWHPSGQQLICNSEEGIIQSVNISDDKVTSMFRGEAPAWSTDGNRLAYRSGNEIRIYDSINKSTVKIYKRILLQSSMIGRLYWSPDGRYISFNVASGFVGKDLNYIVLDISSKKSFTSYEGSYWGGPWLAAKK